MNEVRALYVGVPKAEKVPQAMASVGNKKTVAFNVWFPAPPKRQKPVITRVEVRPVELVLADERLRIVDATEVARDGPDALHRRKKKVLALNQEHIDTAGEKERLDALECPRCKGLMTVVVYG